MKGDLILGNTHSELAAVRVYQGNHFCMHVITWIRHSTQTQVFHRVNCVSGRKLLLWLDLCRRIFAIISNFCKKTD